MLRNVLYLLIRISFWARIPWRWFVGRIGRLYLLAWGVQLGKGLQMWSLPICRRHKNATIEIGDNVKIQNKLTENLAGITHRCVLMANGPGAKIVIGNNVGMSGVVLYAANEIVVEDNVNLAVGVKIYDTDFHPLDHKLRDTHNNKGAANKLIRICQSAWICADAIILKGVTVGPRSIVAAGAIVAKDVPADTIVAGIPARVVKKLL